MKKNTSSSGSFCFTLFHIVIYESDPRAALFRGNTLKNIASNYKSIADWAYILHDRDIYTSEDEKENPLHKAGTSKPSHYHLIIRSNNNKTCSSSIAEWLSIDENCITKPEKGSYKGFNNELLYFTHTSLACRELGKTIYKPNEIKSNIPRIDLRVKAMIKNRSYSHKFIEGLAKLVYSGEENLADVIEKYDLQGEINIIERLNRAYKLGREVEMAKLYSLPLPKVRINIYFYGMGGAGKSFICEYLSQYLYPDLSEDKRVYYSSSESSSVKNYRGQSVIIWDECSADKLLIDLKGRNNFKKVFRINPVREWTNVKYGSVLLSNKYNFINSTEDFETFIRKVSEGDDDKSQYYRRFPIFIKVNENNFTISVNSRVYPELTDKSANRAKQFSTYHLIQKIDFNSEEINSVIHNSDTAFRYVREFLNNTPLLKILTDVENSIISCPLYEGITIEDLCKRNNVDINKVILEDKK